MFHIILGPFSRCIGLQNYDPFLRTTVNGSESEYKPVMVCSADASVTHQSHNVTLSPSLITKGKRDTSCLHTSSLSASYLFVAEISDGSMPLLRFTGKSD